jgi:hypothetical protein
MIFACQRLVDLPKVQQPGVKPEYRQVSKERAAVLQIDAY